MIQVDIITGFLGAGKTTFINKLLREGECANTVLVENEFGEVNVDSHLLGDALSVMEINSGCICCTLLGDFVAGIRRVAEEYKPERILVEPSGAASLADVLSACEKACNGIDAQIRSVVTVVSAEALPALHFAGGPLYRSQIAEAEYILMSGVELAEEEDLAECRDILAELNPHAPLCWEPWDRIRAEDVLREAAEVRGSAAPSRLRLRAGKRMCAETIVPSPMSDAAIETLSGALESGECGQVLRVKGFVRRSNGKCCLLEYVPGRGVCCRETADTEPRLCVIGTELDRAALRRRFGMEGLDFPDGQE